MINKITRTSTTIDGRSPMHFAYIILIFFSFMAVASSESSYVGSDSLVSNGLAAYYSFDGGYAQDVSGNGNDGTIMGAMVSEGKVNQALYFDGINDYVNIPRSIQDSFSIVLWVKTTQTSATGHWWAGNGLVDADQCGETDDFGISLLGNRAAFGVGCSSPPVDVTIKSSKSINDGIWHQIAATRNKDTGEIKLYVDGALEATGAGRSNSLTAPPYIGIGNEPCNIYHNRRWFRGSIDEVRIYDRVLSENAILSLFSRPVPDTQPQLSVELFPSTNVAQSGETVPIRVSVTSNSLPVDADVEIKINNTVVASFKGSDYTYNFPSLFTQTNIGSYDIEATAKYNGLIAKDFKKIEVIGEASKALYCARNIALSAYSEVFQSEDLATSKLTDAEIALGENRIFWFADTFLEGYVKNNVKEILGSDYTEVIEKEIEKAITVIEVPYERILEDLAEIGLDFSNLGPKLPLWENKLKDSQRTMLESQGGWQSVVISKNRIENNYTRFDKKIKQNSEKFISIPGPSGIDFLFDLYSRPIGNVVETTPVLAQGTNFGQTESQLGSYYDSVKECGDSIAEVVLYAVIGLFILGVIASVLAVALAALPAAAAFIAAVLAYTGPALVAIATAGQFWDKALLLVKLSLATMLLFVVPPVVNEVDLQHGGCVDSILSAVGADMAPGPMSIHSINTISGVPTQISTSGHSFVITPDGRISKLIMFKGNYNPADAGTYKIVAYQHANRLFSNLSSSLLHASQPNVKLNSSYNLQGTMATINLQINNHESSEVKNLSTVLVIRNSTEGTIYSKLDIFSLNPGESKIFSYEVDLNEQDVYTAKVLLFRSIAELLDEQTFSVRVGDVIRDDVAILNVDYRNEYSPHDDINMTVTLESFSPGFKLNLSIPSLHFSTPVMLTGTKVINVTLPKLLPDHYVVGIQAEKDGNILDSRIVSFYVRADGVGILTFNTSQLLYTASTYHAINLSLMDLNLSEIDALVSVRVMDPSGGEQNYPAVKTSGGYQFNFLPATNGTYLLEAHAYKEGWRIDNNTCTVIANQMSPLKMEVTIEDYIIANVTANGQPAACNVTIYTPQGAESTIASNGIAIFNATDQFYIVADKMFFEPAFYSFQPYTLHYPDFTDTSNSNSWRSWLVLQNPTDYGAVVNLTIRSRDSSMLYSGIQTIPAHGVRAIRPRNLAGSDCSGSIVITSNQPIVGTCQITRNSNEMCMGYNAVDQGNKTLYYPDFTDTVNPDSWRSWLVLQNPTSSAANITLDIRSRTGDVLVSGSQIIPARSVRAIRPRNLVGSDCAGSVVITSDQPIMGTCQITRNSNKMCMSYTASDQGATALYYPDFTDTTSPDSWRSWLVLQNPSASPANLSYEIRSRAGDLLYTGSDTIPAHSVNAIRPGNLVGSDCAGSVVVTSDQPIVGTCQITRNSNEMCMSYNALDQASTTLSYPDFTDTANPDSWRSWLVLQNPAATAANITLEIRSRAGDLLYTGLQSIPDHGVAAVRSRSLVGSDCTGSVVVTSDQPIVGTCQITRNNNLMCMSYTATRAASVDWLPSV